MALLRLNEDIPKEVVPGCLKTKGCVTSKYLPKDEPFFGLFLSYIIFTGGDYRPIGKIKIKSQ